ncbi:MAG: TRAP transporter small permease [Oscillibacter sp.]|nr:TRAP transporter small permease [Oscillibacter sp.]
MKFLQKLYDGLDRLLSVIVALLMMLITFEIFVQVIFRYFLHKSMGGFEELPVFMLITCVWLGGILVAKHNDHVKIDIITQSIKNEKVQAVLNTATSLLTAVCAGFYTVLDWQFVTKAMEHRSLSPGLQFPLWYVYAVTLVGSALAALFFLINAVKEIRRLWK